MLTMRPPPRARMCGSTAREQRICANSLMSRSACHCSSLSVSKLPGVARPALLTRRSIPPKRPADLRPRRLDLGLVAGADRDLGALPRQLQRNGLPQPLTAARDEGDLAL